MTSDLAAIAAARVVLEDGTAAAVRRAAGVSARQLGQSIGASSGTVSSWESGRRSPRDPQLCARFLAAVQGLADVVNA
jgi:DNA-binding transcriptional regulator YiaG